ncbi:hypothetical protein TSOC_004417 [Tetrabaena socialis]|uniref:Uncharacterized protein n=1 Tax=Tetrabaena socialis TaxID=47790 RepID=A0A2J8A925_9CHLO|nr:hypothetical protein TSOC_004417 [Tetrabaena socialis]|eukprot:PNH09010.1 hypothetical protein TSOC_004417 [Tetrabaena socialis]
MAVRRPDGCRKGGLLPPGGPEVVPEAAIPGAAVLMLGCWRPVRCAAPAERAGAAAREPLELLLECSKVRLLLLEILELLQGRCDLHLPEAVLRGERLLVVLRHVHVLVARPGPSQLLPESALQMLRLDELRLKS